MSLKDSGDRSFATLAAISHKPMRDDRGRSF